MSTSSIEHGSENMFARALINFYTMNKILWDCYIPANILVIDWKIFYSFENSLTNF